MSYKIFLFIIVFIASISAQSLSLEKGESGIGIAAVLGKSNNGSSKSFSLGYSHQGVLGLRIGVGDFSYSEKLFGSDLSANRFFVGLDFLLLKERNNFPFSFGFAMNYLSSEYHNKVLKDFNNTAESNYYDFGLIISKGFSISESIKLRPVVYGKYSWGKSEVHGSPVILEIIDEELIYGTIESKIEYTFDQIIFVFSPSVQISKYVPFYNFSISLIYDFN
jgi:hypothetical protein